MITLSVRCLQSLLIFLCMVKINAQKTREKKFKQRADIDKDRNIIFLYTAQYIKSTAKYDIYYNGFI